MISSMFLGIGLSKSWAFEWMGMSTEAMMTDRTEAMTADIALRYFISGIYVSVVKVHKYSACANFVYLKLLLFHFRLSRAASCSSLGPGLEVVVFKMALLEREALLLLVTHAVVVHCLQRVKVQSYGLAGKEAGRKEHRIRAQNRHFCARAEGQVASGSVKVAFLQITAHVSKIQMPHNQIINF